MYRNLLFGNANPSRRDRSREDIDASNYESCDRTHCDRKPDRCKMCFELGVFFLLQRERFNLLRFKRHLASGCVITATQHHGRSFAARPAVRLSGRTVVRSDLVGAATVFEAHEIEIFVRAKVRAQRLVVIRGLVGC